LFTGPYGKIATKQKGYIIAVSQVEAHRAAVIPAMTSSDHCPAAKKLFAAEPMKKGV